MARRVGSVAALVAAAVLLAACEGTTGTKEDEAAEQQAPAEVAELSTEERTAMPPVGSTTGLGEPVGFQGDLLDDPASELANRTVYFEFDSAEIVAQDRPTIEAHANYLAGNPSASVTLEGHTDERGTREYNVALGERRANGVRQLMTLVGASTQQVRTISYGEERPAAEGHDEVAWAANRRVEIIYRTR